MKWALAGAALVAAGAAGGAQTQAQTTLLGVPCTSPPPVHCAPSGCTGAETAAPGNAVDARTGRRYFLDYPCDLKPGEKVIFVLNLHGGGSIGNWQRHYFPIMDLKEKYRLVVATPSGSNNGWNPGLDDQHLRNIVADVYTGLGYDRIKAFWLAGHSLGGQTSNRLINNDPIFSERLTGWVSLSGGRLGSRREDVRAPIPSAPAGSTPAPARAGRAGPPPGAAGRGAAPPAGGRGPGGLVADASVLPQGRFSFIYETGEHELTAAGLPKSSPWAQKLGCRPQAAPREVVDTQAGYVMDSREQANPNKVWGLKARPGTAKIYAYPNCPGRRVVADVVRIDKGHTEGLEPRITEEIVKMMVAAS